jgi:cytochrome b6-f complex iron-sulfur subunit
MQRRALEILAISLTLAAIALLAFSPRSEREPGNGPRPSRRSFLNYTLLGALGVFAAAFGGGSIAFLWPEPRGVFGSKINAGRLDDVLARFKLGEMPIYNIEGHFYLVPYDTTDPNNAYVRAGVAAAGVMVLFQKCSHLGCRVPYCQTSGWFECPCHGARFNLAGEVRNGPAPAGMWRFPIEVTPRGNIVVDTHAPRAQPPMGTDTTGQQPAGEFCVRD